MADTEPKNPRPDATPAEIDELFTKLTSDEAPKSTDQYEAARQWRAEDAKKEIAALALQLREHTDGSTDLNAVRAIYRSLDTVKQRTLRAIAAIPNEAIQLNNAAVDDGLGL